MFLSSYARRGIQKLSEHPAHLEADADLKFFFEAVIADVVEQGRSTDPAASDLLDFIKLVAEWLPRSQSQLLQDIWVIKETKRAQAGFFIEVGAADGKALSNTYLLEHDLDWTGIVCEPNPIYLDKIKENRTCRICTSCVHTASDETVLFRCTDEPEFSVITDYAMADVHGESRRSRNFDEITVPTISLNDLLVRYSCPTTIDYLSLDTEGTELAILSAFDFDRWDVRLITVEHNHTDNRDSIHELLTSHGYRRTMEGFSRWDDWYVKHSD